MANFLPPNSTNPSTPQQQKSALDWLLPSSTSTTAIETAPPDLFESELDLSLAQLPSVDQAQLHLLDFAPQLDTATLFPFRTTAGPPSAITVSSESLSAYSSHYGSNFQEYTTAPLDFDLDFSAFNVTDPNANLSKTVATADIDPLASLMSTTTGSASPSFSPYNSNFDFDANDFGSDYSYTSSVPASGTRPAPTAASILAPAHTQHPSLPSAPVHNQARESNALNQQQNDPRRKYPCPSCPRSFARAFNLKTHMATHDPNRLKPHVCPHRSCGRSFSRKHDLGRHLVSIHRDAPGAVEKSKVQVKSENGVGVGKGDRQWCEECGSGWIAGVGRPCACHDSEREHVRAKVT